MKPVYAYRARLARVIDGDTYEMDVDLGFNVWVRHPVRLRGFFAAELDTAEGAEAAAEAARLFRDAGEIVVSTQKNKRGRDVQSFARYVADVWLDGVLLSEAMARAFPDPAGSGAKQR